MTAPLSIKRVHHVARVTASTDASVAFYRDVLGFRELERPSFNFSGSWLFNYGVQIHIIENTKLAARIPDGIDTRDSHLALDVADIDEAKSNLESRGIDFHEQVNAGGIHQVFFRDPDGHLVEIAVYPPNPPYRT